MRTLFFCAIPMPCKLCGLPLPKPPVSDAGHDFCCIGCREVYRAFGEDALIAEKVSPRSTAAKAASPAVA